MIAQESFTILSLLILVSQPLQVAPFGMTGEIKVPEVPRGHPRVYVRPHHPAAIRAKLRSPEFARAWGIVRAYARRDKAGGGRAFCRACVYLLTGHRKQGR